MKGLNVVAASLLALAPTGSWADAVDEFVIAEMARLKVPGLTVGIVHKGQVVKAEGYGFANLEHRVPAKRETVYQSGSMAKQFTAAAVMILVQDGKLQLDDRIGKYVDGVPKSWERISIRNLLNHTGGIWDGKFFGGVVNMREDLDDEQLLRAIFKLDPITEPGYSFGYSNAGYALLGVIVSKVAGMFYGDFLKARVFDPAGMKTARIISESDIIPNRAAGYRLVDGTLKNQIWIAPTWNRTADGSMYVTVDDLIQWDAALYTERVLARESLVQMWSPVKTGVGSISEYGFGWFLSGIPGHRRIWHAGAWQGFSGRVERFPDDELTVIVLTNLGYPHAMTANFTSRLAQMFLKPAKPAPSR